MSLTPRGIALLVAAAALLATGFGSGYPELTLLGTSAAIALACAVAYAAQSPRLELTRAAEPDRVARGESATMTLTVRNGGRLRTTNLVAEDRCGARPVAVPLLRLRPGRDTTVSYPVPTHRRGVVSIGPLRVIRRDVLGLVSVARGYGSSARVWVHPRIHPLGTVPAGVARSLDGRLDRVPYGSITFDSLREYVVGDELRRVHWRTSARIGALMVRENVDTSRPRIVVLLDNRAAAHPVVVDGVAETFESACEAAASVIAATTREGLPVTLLLAIEDGASGGYLDRLAEVDLPRDEDPGRDVDARREVDARRHGEQRGTAASGLNAAINRLRQQPLGDTLIVLTGPGARDELGLFGALRGPYASVLVGVFGARHAPASAVDGMMVIDAADGREFAARWDGVARW